MKRILYFLFFLLFASSISLFAQNAPPANLSSLTIEKIMQDQRWIGISPTNVFWSPDSRKIYFEWAPSDETSDSLYFVSLKNHTPQLCTSAQRLRAEAEAAGTRNQRQNLLAFVEQNTLYLLNIPANKLQKLIETTEPVSNLQFGLNDRQLFFQKGDNLFSIDLQTHAYSQLTDFQKGEKEEKKQLSAQETFLHNDALENSMILRQEKIKKEKADSLQNAVASKDLPKTIYIGKQELAFLDASPDGNFIYYELMNDPGTKNTVVPDYVTASGYTSSEEGRPVVGTAQPTFKSYIYDRRKDTVYAVATKQIPGIRDIPEFMLKYYPKEAATLRKDTTDRNVFLSNPFWNPAGTSAFVVVRAQDHKDRWLMELNIKNGKLKLLDRQHDSAWIGGPGVGYPYEIGNVGWIDNNTIWFQSEVTGYSHLYTLNVETGAKTPLTQGKYEVQSAQLSPDHKSFYITTNEVEPSQNQFYRLDIQTKKQTRITQMKGGHNVTVSPDGNYLADLFSTIVHPWELYLQPNKANSTAVQITHKAESAAYKAYPWLVPKIITFKDRDGQEVYASVYRPEKQAASQPGVVFVHGAGYWQDVIRSWSYYFREHMFMNMLADNGYTVMDIDYRGSAGYGRDWRTAVYRHMGGNDLEDIVDGAKYMIRQMNVNPAKVGIWGGSYGGFMTLMALFKTPTFACGAALRSVTDWAHYNHDYTSDILNLPQNDSLAYVQSSPIYFANGLQGKLLMCHGVIDPNVHFQDIIRLNQKLIELGKKNWSLAVYPLEGHDFKYASSWTDEYNRIFKLFQESLR